MHKFINYCAVYVFNDKRYFNTSEERVREEFEREIKPVNLNSNSFFK